MNFQFKVTTTEEEYFDFNKFHALRSEYGKKQLMRMRIFTAIPFILGMGFFAFPMIKNGYNPFDLIGLLFLAAVFASFEILLPRLIEHSVKANIAALKKNGKLPYSASSLLEFHDDKFIEITETNKTEQSYSAIERIDVIEGKTIYFFTSAISAFILPLSCFNSQAEYDEFTAFIKTKCEKINIHSLLG